jgi:acyl-CoA synthetase (AMP-forming)/AMP-acid ligase II
MPDLVRPAKIAEITTLLGAPFANTFGATETGCPPCSAGVIPVGEAPTAFPKEQSGYCEVRLVDPEGRDVPDGVPGEVCMRGPTLFSGYWNDPGATSADFRDGWFHMGDVLVRDPDGRLTFVDRVKYMIKSGGENIYPAEIERVLLRLPGVLEAGVVRRPDPTWGEVAVAFVVHADEGYKPTDPRAEVLFELATSLGFPTLPIRLVRAVSAAGSEVTGRALPVNVTGAIGTVVALLDLDWRIARGLGVISRTVGLVGHLREELAQPMATTLRRTTDAAATRHVHQPRT